jgi:hypothetical protein
MTLKDLFFQRNMIRQPSIGYAVGRIDTESLDTIAEESACSTNVSGRGIVSAWPFALVSVFAWPVSQQQTENWIANKKPMRSKVRLIELQKYRRVVTIYR